MLIYRIVGRWRSLKPIPCANGSSFQPNPASHVLAYFRCEEYVLGGKIDFLIDTGADITTIMPDDRENICIPRRALHEECPLAMRGIGGTIPIRYVRDLTLQFYSASGKALDPLKLERIGVLCPPKEVRRAYKGTPSLLGRDFLDRCHIDIAEDEIILTYED